MTKVRQNIFITFCKNVRLFDMSKSGPEGSPEGVKLYITTFPYESDLCLKYPTSVFHENWKSLKMS